LISWRHIARLLKRSDMVIEVLDIRDPITTRSRKVEELARILSKEIIVVLNKSDLVPKRIADLWIKKFNSYGLDTITFSMYNKKSKSILLKKLEQNLVYRDPLTASIVGYPKTGKSTIINSLKGKKSASTSPIPGSPGYTKSFTRYKIRKGIYIIDTPGIIPYGIGYPDSVIRGKNVEELKDPVRPAIDLLRKILSYNPDAIAKAYGIGESDPYKILETLALKRMWIYKKSKEPIIEEAAKTIIRDYHKAKIKFFVPPL